jgi:phage head maturation protease
MSELFVRNSTLTAVDHKLRVIDMVVVPWEEEADVLYRGELWREVFTRSAYDGIEGHAGRVRVNREHVKGDTVGKAVHFDPSDSVGLLGRVKIAETVRGDETLALAEEDMISPSVGFYLKAPSDQVLNKRTMVRRINRAFIDHIALVESPAYAGAQVLAVRADQSELTVTDAPLPSTPLLDELMNADVLAWVTARLNRS